jgi:hypothetical protein
MVYGVIVVGKIEDAVNTLYLEASKRWLVAVERSKWDEANRWWDVKEGIKAAWPHQFPVDGVGGSRIVIDGHLGD